MSRGREAVTEEVAQEPSGSRRTAREAKTRVEKAKCGSVAAACLGGLRDTVRDGKRGGGDGPGPQGDGGSDKGPGFYSKKNKRRGERSLRGFKREV